MRYPGQVDIVGAHAYRQREAARFEILDECRCSAGRHKLANDAPTARFLALLLELEDWTHHILALRAERFRFIDPDNSPAAITKSVLLNDNVDSRDELGPQR